MRILLLAYACEPNKGSEPGVGWNWAINLSNLPNKEVCVITRRNNKESIENYFTKNSKPKNLVFYYYDLPYLLVFAKQHGLPVNIYYSWWLIGVSFFAKRLHQEYRFDIAHHITFGVFRDPCPLTILGIPYFIGPVGGGEETPSRLFSLYTIKDRIKEKIRKCLNNISLLNPLLIKTYNHASLIMAKTMETKNVLKKWKVKTIVNLEIGINSVDEIECNRDCNTFLFVGRFTYWKGIMLVLMAFKQYQATNSKAKLLMIGEGEMRTIIKTFSARNKLNIEVVPWIKKEELIGYYRKACAMIFPSLHDSSGNVVLESLSCCLPVICLDCGGPATILGKNLRELIVSTVNNSTEQVIDDIVDRMKMLSTDKILYKSIQERVKERAKQQMWRDVVQTTYLEIESKLQYMK